MPECTDAERKALDALHEAGFEFRLPDARAAQQPEPYRPPGPSPEGFAWTGEIRTAYGGNHHVLRPLPEGDELEAEVERARKDYDIWSAPLEPQRFWFSDGFGTVDDHPDFFEWLFAQPFETRRQCDRAIIKAVWDWEAFGRQSAKEGGEDE